MEGVPKPHETEVSTDGLEKDSGRELSMETLRESVERAMDLSEALKQLDRTESDGSVIALNKQEWEEAGALSKELKETLKFIPAKQCLDNHLPYHPTDEKYEYPRSAFPDQPDYPLDYTHQKTVTAYPDRYPRADELAEVA